MSWFAVGKLIRCVCVCVCVRVCVCVCVCAMLGEEASLLVLTAPGPSVLIIERNREFWCDVSGNTLHLLTPYPLLTWVGQRQRQWQRHAAGQQRLLIFARRAVVLSNPHDPLAHACYNLHMATGLRLYIQHLKSTILFYSILFYLSASPNPSFSLLIRSNPGSNSKTLVYLLSRARQPTGCNSASGRPPRPSPKADP